MERLTKRLPSGAADYNYPKSCYIGDRAGADRISQSAFRQRCVEQLADYEDTGLTPEEFHAYWVFLEDMIGEQKASEALDRFRQLVKADKDGRLVVLPSNKALTNADRMRTATNQQLAKQLYDTQKELCRILYEKLGFEDELNFSEDYSDILAWLNAPSKEAEKALEAMK